MKNTFEQLTVWILARTLNKSLGDIFYNPKFRNYSFQDQIMRASLSVSNNIAEGRERGSNPDFIKFLYYAKGSTGEVRSMLYSALDLGYITEKQFDEYYKSALSLGIKIYNLIQAIKKQQKILKTNNH